MTSSPGGRTDRRRTGSDGQILVLFAASLFVLVAVAALAIEVTSVYSVQRFERSVADVSALAAVQDLQPGSSRVNPTTTAKQTARRRALERAAAMIGGSVPASCNTNTNVTDCKIGQYLVSVATPSLTKKTSLEGPASGDRKAIRVTVRRVIRPGFARLFGQTSWNVGITSVATIRYQKQYAFVTLRPPQPSSNGNTDNNENNIKVSGTGTRVNVIGDVGTNTNLVIDGGAKLLLDADSVATYYDSYQAWTGAPTGERNPDLILDPNYAIPSASGADQGSVITGSACTSAIAAATAAGYKGRAPTSTNKPATYDLTTGNTTCLKAGVFSSDPGQGIGNTQTLLLTPGVYFFEGGLTMNGTLIGGYQESTAGVALVFNEVNRTSAGAFKGNSATFIALNAGRCAGVASPAACTRYAAPALTHDGVPVGGDIDTEGFIVPLTLIVKKDPNCVVRLPYPVACDENGNGSLNLAGGGSLYAYGVQYAPTDNVAISGGAEGLGYVGQIISWTVAYSGGSQIQLSYPAGVRNGIIRLDAACSGRGEPCR